jgi:hypothetical protein
LFACFFNLVYAKQRHSHLFESAAQTTVGLVQQKVWR